MLYSFGVITHFLLVHVVIKRPISYCKTLKYILINEVQYIVMKFSASRVRVDDKFRPIFATPNGLYDEILLLKSEYNLSG